MLERLAADFPQQFKEKNNIEAIASAFDKQVKQVTDVFDSIRFDTALDTAVGKQLDRIGEIVGLTRAEAALLCGKEIYFSVLDDERYRTYLKYKAYKNSNNCTYYDLVNELTVVCGVEKVGYEEDENYPATVILTVPLSGDKGENNIGQIPTIAPAGVSVLYKYRLGTSINVSMVSNIYVTSNPMCGTFYCGTFPKEKTEQGG